VAGGPVHPAARPGARSPADGAGLRPHPGRALGLDAGAGVCPRQRHDVRRAVQRAADRRPRRRHRPARRSAGRRKLLGPRARARHPVRALAGQDGAQPPGCGRLDRHGGPDRRRRRAHRLPGRPAGRLRRGLRLGAAHRRPGGQGADPGTVRRRPGAAGPRGRQPAAHPVIDRRRRGAGAGRPVAGGPAGRPAGGGGDGGRRPAVRGGPGQLTCAGWRWTPSRWHRTTSTWSQRPRAVCSAWRPG
jgi:hypothetical protein